MNPLLKEYLEGKLGADYAQKNKEQLESIESGARVGNLFGDLGDVIAGRQIGSTDAFFQGRAKSKKEQIEGAEKKALAEYDVEKSLKSDKADQEKLARESDANSEESKLARELAIRMGMAPEKAQGLTAARFASISPALQKIYDIESKKEDNRLKREEMNLKRQEVNKDINRLPEEDKVVVKELASKNAGKAAIKTQIDAVVSQLPSLTEKQALQQGRQLIKVLNSTQGQDAVGAEEAKRLAGKLEFALGGLTSGNYGQFGRDVKGFFEDAQITSAALKDSIDQNNKIIQNAYSRVGIKKDPSSIYSFSDQQISDEDKKAYDWAMNNPQDPRSAKILKKLNVGGM